ncbi:unnamed protein product [Moneuplotes crassus]|uniref:Alpha/beta hydrolase fold-3 domain-containing protein n=1 Tax=Euplotes crassus TaxID=5936 RepID=A0AAD1U3A3_EUPCR|nr:unnamed protein product [Moneuplotes crassus]
MEEYKDFDDKSPPAIANTVRDTFCESFKWKGSLSRNSLSNDFKIPRSTSFQPKTPRLFEALEYQHVYTETDLFQTMKVYLEQKISVEKELINFIEKEIDDKLMEHIPKQIHETLPEISEKIRCLEVVYYIILQHFNHFEASDGNSEVDYDWDIEEISRVKEIMYEIFPTVKPDVIEEFLSGDRTICVSAVMLTMKAINGLNDMLANVLNENLKIKDSVKIGKIVIYAIKLAFCFEFLYSSLMADKESIFFNENNTRDIAILNKHLDVINPFDLDNHLKRLEKAGNNIGFYMGIAQKGFQHKSYTKSLVSMAYYSSLYFLNSKSGSDNGNLFMHTLEPETFGRMIQFPENRYIQSILTLTASVLSKVEVSKIIYVPISRIDQLTHETYLDNSSPFIVENRSGLNFMMTSRDVNPSDYVKVNIITNQDWGKVNWKTGKLLDPAASPAHIDGIILFIHGGGFISTSTGVYQPLLRKMNKETGYPIFSVDYRLAPKYAYPTGLSDCWMVYLWLQYYAEEYLQLTFDKIILAGDSAGGNLCTGVTLLSLLKSCKVPTGLSLIYPGMLVSRTHFIPSMLYSLDDYILNTVVLDFCVSSYDTKNNGDKDFLLSPNLAPEELICNDGKVCFPMTRIIISGNDPLRDTSLEFIIKMAKLGVDIQAVDYQYQIHGFIMFNMGPISFKESDHAIEKCISYTKEIIDQNADS